MCFDEGGIPKKKLNFIKRKRKKRKKKEQEKRCTHVISFFFPGRLSQTMYVSAFTYNYYQVSSGIIHARGANHLQLIVSYNDVIHGIVKISMEYSACYRGYSPRNAHSTSPCRPHPRVPSRHQSPRRSSTRARAARYEPDAIRSRKKRCTER